MDGVPGLSTAEQAKVDANTTAGQAGTEQPPSALSWLQDDNIALLREWSARCSHVAACHRGMDYDKSWAFCASFQSVARLSCACRRKPGAHQSIAGVQVGDKFLSSLTAEYPASLAAALASLVRPFLSSQGHVSASVSVLAGLLTEDFVPRRLRLCDGGGVRSNADHSIPESNNMLALTQAWVDWFHANDMVKTTLQHLAAGAETHPLSQQQQLEIVNSTRKRLCPDPEPGTAMRVESGQPFR